MAHAERAARAYKDINRLALKLLEPGGVLLTFSCSGGVGADLFHKIDLEVDRSGHADADAEHVARRAAAAAQQFAHQRTHARQHDRGAVAHVGRFLVLREHREVGLQHGDAEAGGADVDAHEHAEVGMELEVFGAASARGALQAGFGQQALLEQPGDERIGLALGEAEFLGHGMARTAGRPEGGLQQTHFVRSDAAPGCHARLSPVLCRDPAASRPAGEGEY